MLAHKSALKAALARVMIKRQVADVQDLVAHDRQGQMAEFGNKTLYPSTLTTLDAKPLTSKPMLEFLSLISHPLKPNP